MEICDILIVLLVFTCAGLLSWCLWLHSTREQMRGSVERVERMLKAEFSSSPDDVG